MRHAVPGWTTIAGVTCVGVLVSALNGAHWSPVSHEIAFEEVSASAGIDHVGETHGMAWGDFNGDGWPDLWVGNHRDAPSLYLNQADGTFVDIAAAVVTETQGDTHGAAWADFDRDGDQDLVELSGAVSGTGSDPNHLFVSHEGLLFERAVPLGVDYPLGRGRTPLWFDADGDGMLDLLIANMARPDFQAPTAFFRQVDGKFQEANDLAGFQSDKSSFIAQLTDLTGDHVLDLIVHGWPYPQKIYQVGSFPFSEVQPADLGLPITGGNVLDVVIGDFFNDLLPDIFLLRAFEGRSGAMLISGQELRVSIQLEQNEYGIRFRSSGEATFDLYGTNINPVAPDGIFIGADGAHPISTTFTLSPADPQVAGIFPHAPGEDEGVYIGFDSGAQDWYLYCSSPAACELSGIFLTGAPIVDWQTLGFQASGTPPRDRFLSHSAGVYLDITGPAGLGGQTDCGSAVSADFDNDMDPDLYQVCTHPVANLPNILYANQGDGTFVALPGAGGAEGSTAGRGDGVVAADYDQDGFIDLFVANGKGSVPFNQGPHQLFRNLGNENHWLEIDLMGIQSNPHGIGATVWVTAGGVTQMREQDGGIHRFSQNHQRLHFGLAQNALVDRVEVHWPSGIVQSLDFVAADQVLQIVEADTSATSTPTASPTTTPTNTPSPTASQTPSPTWTNTSTPSPTLTPSPTWTNTSTSSPTFTPSPTETGSPTHTPTFTASPTGSFTPSPTSSSTATFTMTPTPSPTGTATPSPTPTETPGPTATQTPGDPSHKIFLPVVLRESHIAPDNPHSRSGMKPGDIQKEASP